MPTLINNSAETNWFTVEHTDKPYTMAAMDIKYLWNEGLVQLPVAEESGQFPGSDPRPLCEIVRSHAPTGQLVITWMAKREHVMPYLLHPLSENTNLVLARMDITGHSPKLTSNGVTRIYRVSGQYVYYFKKPVFPPGDGGWMGWCPYDKIAPQLNVMSAADFKRVF